MRKRARTAGITVALSLLSVVSACGADTTAISTSTPTSTSTTTTTTTIAPATSTSGVTTTPPAATDGGTILVVGDWGTGTAPEGAVAGAMQRFSEENEVTAVLTTGDNFYSDDAEFIMHPYGWMEEAGAEWWITWGNHDVETPTRIETLNEVFDEPPRWTSLDWGDVNVVILDSTQVGSPEQGDFLATMLAETDEPTIVVFHHPPHSCGTHGGTTETQEEFVSLFDADVFLVLNGHEHNYQRFDAGDVTYVVSGGGGAGLTELSTCSAASPPLVTSEMLHHFLALTKDGEGGLVLQAIDVNGAIFDEVTLVFG